MLILSDADVRRALPIAEKLARLSEVVDAAEVRVTEVARTGVTPAPIPFPIRSEPAATPA